MGYVLAFKWNNNEDINLIGQWNPFAMKLKNQMIMFNCMYYYGIV